MKPSHNWRTIPLPPLPDPARPVVLAIRPGEVWCRNCGEHGVADQLACCKQPAPVRVTEILYPEEYRLRN